MSLIYRGELHDESILLFFVLINFQLLAKHFSVFPSCFMKLKDSLEKRYFEINFEFQG